MTPDQDTLDEIAARLVGRIEILYLPAERGRLGRFRVNTLSPEVNDFVFGSSTKERAWADALDFARLHEGVIFGPPGYDVEL